MAAIILLQLRDAKLSTVNSPIGNPPPGGNEIFRDLPSLSSTKLLRNALLFSHDLTVLFQVHNSKNSSSKRDGEKNAYEHSFQPKSKGTRERNRERRCDGIKTSWGLKYGHQDENRKLEY